MVNICEAVDLFLRKPFWFFLRMLSMLGSMRFPSRALYVCIYIYIYIHTICKQLVCRQNYLKICQLKY